MIWSVLADAIIGHPERRACIMLTMSKADSSLSDGEIIKRVLGGDVGLFEIILDRYRARVFGLVGRRVPRDDVGEVAHDVFVRAYVSLASYRGAGDFDAWVSKIAVRAACDYWRERYRRREQPMSSLTEDQLRRVTRMASAQSSREFDGRQSLDDARELLTWAMGKLSPEDRAVLELVHLEGRSVKEAAALLGWSVANVKVRGFRSRRKLRAILEKTLSAQGGDA